MSNIIQQSTHFGQTLAPTASIARSWHVTSCVSLPLSLIACLMSTAPKATSAKTSGSSATSSATGTAASGTASGSTASGTTHTSTASTTPLNKLIETPEFLWFSAHALALITYALGFLFRKGAFSTLLSKVFFIAEFASFGLILFEKYGTKVVPRQLAVDDNAHYFFLSLLWVLVQKRVFTATPFAIYSLFHALTYARAYLLPALGHPKDSSLNKQIEQFIKTRNNSFTAVASLIEFGELIYLGTQLLWPIFTFYKANFVVFALYAAFFRFRYAVSPYTRQAVHSFEVKVDGVANSVPALKDAWIKFKSAVAQIPGPTKVN